MMKLRHRLLVSAAFSAAIAIPSVALLTTLDPAYAQNTATPVVDGYVSLTGCVPSTLTSCFIQYGIVGNVTALPVNVVAGNISAGNITVGNITIAGGNLTGITDPITIANITGIPSVAISQTTPGTTNGVQVTNSSINVSVLNGVVGSSIDQIANVTANTAAAGTLLVGLADGNGTKVYSTSNALNIDCIAGCAGNVTVGNISLAAGTATIGNISTILNALPSGTNTLGNITTVTNLGNITGTPTFINGNGSLSNDLGIVVVNPSTKVACSAICANLTVNGASGKLASFEVSADSTLSGAAWWVMIFDAAAAPADGAVTPAKCYALPTGATTLSAAFPIPATFTSGIVITASTNGCFTKAQSAHAFISGDYQ